MPSNQITRVDFCKSPLQAGKQLTPASPVDAVEPLGLASCGCSPLLSTRAASNDAILSRFNQNNGAYVNSLLTTDADLGDNTQPEYSAYIAGFAGTNPLTGSVANPYPASFISWQFDYQFDGRTAFREQFPSGSSPSFGQNPVGFGVNMEPYPTLILGGGEEFDGLLPNRRPYKPYRQTFRSSYCPTDSLIAWYDAPNSQLTSEVGALGTSWATSLSIPLSPPNTVYSVTLFLWEVRPTLTSFSGTTITPNLITNNTHQQEPPGFTRRYALYDNGNLSMPGWGGSISATYAITPIRPWLVAYCTAEVDSVTLNGVGGSAFTGSISNIKLPDFSPPNIFNFPQSFSWALSPLTNSFAFTVTVGGQTLTPAVQTVGNPAIPRYYEAYIVGQIAVNP